MNTETKTIDLGLVRVGQTIVSHGETLEVVRVTETDNRRVAVRVVNTDDGFVSTIAAPRMARVKVVA